MKTHMLKTIDDEQLEAVSGGKAGAGAGAGPGAAQSPFKKAANLVEGVIAANFNALSGLFKDLATLFTNASKN